MEPFHGTERYVIRSQLGAGGMGVVYEALDRERDMVVALKTLQQASPGAIARFKREFRSLADVIHPNLVALYELSAEDQLFFTMELIRGLPFHRWVRSDTEDDPTLIDADGEPERTDATFSLREGPSDSGRRAFRSSRGSVDVRRLRLAVRQLAEGVAAIHDAGLLHRDLKPSNVLITDDGRVVVLDFGLVTDLSEETAALVEDRPLEGTATFMSPEQGARLPLTPASDWYSVGVMLYVALTGRPPFLGGRDDVLMDKQRFEPPPPRELAPDAPGDLNELCVELLRRDPERRPPGADVLRRLGSAAAIGTARHHSLASSQAGYDVMVGREYELALLGEAYHASADRPVVVHVHGPSGVGKSRLVRAFLDNVAQDDAVVLRGRCYERESVPFKAVDSLVDELSRYLVRLPQLDAEGLMPRDALALARVFPVMRQVKAVTDERRRAAVSPDPLELRRRAFGALRELLTRLADRKPVVLAIDDLQWGDVDSAALLTSLLQPPDAPALLLLCCYRSDDRATGPFLVSFDRQVERFPIDAREVAVAPLTEEQARELAAIHLGGDRADLLEVAERVAAESQGSPFFVEELARHSRGHGAEPVSLGDVLRRRILRLPEQALALLETVAVGGGPVEQTAAFRAAGVTDPAMLSLLKAGSFMRTRSAGGHTYLEPYHDRVRETAVALLDPGELREHHRALARVFEAAPHPDPEILATHYHGAGDLARASGLAAAAAARATAALAFERAARLYQAAIEWSPAAPDRTLFVALGDALANAGRGAEAADAYLAAVDGATAADALDLRSRAIRQLLWAGHIDRGLEELRHVVDAVGMKMASSPRGALASLLWHRARLALRGLRYREQPEREIPASQLVKIDVAFGVAEGLGMADTIHAADFQSRSILLALKAGEPRRVARALAAEAVFGSLRGVGHRKAVDATLERAHAIADALGDPASQAVVLGAAGMAAFNFGEWVRAYDQCTRACQIVEDECAGMRWELSTARLIICFSLALMGRVREMTRRYPQLVKEAYERGDLHAATSLRAALGMYVPLSAGDAEGAVRELDDALAQWSQRGFHLVHANALNSYVCIDLYRGDGAAAHRRCEQAWPALKASLLLRSELMYIILTALRERPKLHMIARGEAGDQRARWLRDAERAGRALQRTGNEHADAVALHLLGAAAHLRGDTERADRLLAQGVARAEASDLCLNAASLRRLRGLIVGGDTGAALIREADAYFTGEGCHDPASVARIFAPGFE